MQTDNEEEPTKLDTLIMFVFVLIVFVITL